MILYRSLRRDLADILVKSSLRGPCVILCGLLCEDLMEILANCFVVWSLHDLVRVLLVKIVLKSSKRSWHDLVPVLVRRSCGVPVQILPERCSH